MRILYLDESGIGKLEVEPVIVVSGVIIHADTQWRSLSDHLASLLGKHCPDGVTPPAVLHATDIYHGTKEFHRDIWPRKSREALLDDIAKIPADFDLTVIWGWEDRREFAGRWPELSPEDVKRHSYEAATVRALVQAEWYMRNCVPSSEVLSVTIEQNRDLQGRIGDIFQYMKLQKSLDEVGRDGIVEQMLPITKIIDQPNFQSKTGSSILQLADFCAFWLKRAAREATDARRYVKPFAHRAMIYNFGQAPPFMAPRSGLKRSLLPVQAPFRPR